MAHQSHIKSKKFRQWVKAGLGLGYLKEGLALFCDDVAKQQHKDILENIKQTKNITFVFCGKCTLNTLQPDHVKLGTLQCPLGHTNCNCCYTSGKTPCPNNVCGAFYDSIITYHASTPPAPNWKNTKTQEWITDPWSIAKCFINATGYEQKTSSADTDCTGLLHVIINNKYFHNHVSCNMSGPNIFYKVRQYRNEIFHSSTMELDSPKTNSYIDNMIAVLQECKELTHKHDAQEAVIKLQDLKNEDFVITTNDVEQVLREIREEMGFIKITMEATKEDCEDLKRNVDTLETFISELKEVINYLKEDSSKKNTDFATLKADLREKLVVEYRQNLLQVPAMPCQPEHLCDFRDVYINPVITIKSKDKDGPKNKTETVVKEMSDIFVKDEKPLKSIYILGEAGSGKSCFCKSIVQCWCMATKNLDGQEVRENTQDIVDSIKVMKNFEFLFFLPLRRCTDKESITEMVKEEYGHPILNDLLECESETCLIVLDGLDEWKSGITSPPKRAKFSNYTVLTTSRPWKIGSIGISDNEMQQNIHIKGFNFVSKTNIITKTVNILNKTFKKDKDPRSCEDALHFNAWISLPDTHMMIQQQICLWFEDKLFATCKCSMYTNMLDLFFVWYKKKVPDAPIFNDMLDKSNGLELPEYLNNTDECKSHGYIIQGVSRLAYETLIKNEKETSLTFDSSMFEQLGISDDIMNCCLKIGIVSEEKGPSMSAGRSRKSHISFIHKSVQEYLAAVYIALNIKIEQESSLDFEKADISVYLSKMFNVKTVDELLEQENVFVILCGLEPRIAQFISKFIYDIVTRDERVVRYRTTIEDAYNDCSIITNIQKLILNCLEETKASNKMNQCRFYLGDLFDSYQYISILERVNEPNITVTLDSVMSLTTHLSELTKGEYDGRKLDCVTRCKYLEAIKINCDFDEELHQRICSCIESNALTLKCISVQYQYQICVLEIFRTPLFGRIASMTYLVAIKVANFIVTHEDFASLCTFLSGTGNLQQISINIECECRQRHEVNLSKHKQLQYLGYCKSVVVTNADVTNLEVIKCQSLNEIDCINVLDLLMNSMKLKEIVLYYDSSSKLGQQDYYIAITRKLTHVISLSQQLRKLTLKNFTFTENIIRCPSEMKSLQSIILELEKMSLTTWLKFVDSVAELPQPAKVSAWFMFITRDGEECNPDLYWWEEGKGEVAAAFQYVRDREALFDVSTKSDANPVIVFSTKK